MAASGLCFDGTEKPLWQCFWKRFGLAFLLPGEAVACLLPVQEGCDAQSLCPVGGIVMPAHVGMRPKP